MKKEGNRKAGIGTKAHLLIVQAPFYPEISNELAKGALAAVEKAGATFERVTVPGSLEIPGAIAIAAASGRFDGYVALGCVIRGETTHYEIVANESARGLMDLAMQGLCIGNGILTCENEEQAMERAGTAKMDKGGGAAEAALAMVRLKRLMKPKTRR